MQRADELLDCFAPCADGSQRGWTLPTELGAWASRFADAVACWMRSAKPAGLSNDSGARHGFVSLHARGHRTQQGIYRSIDDARQDNSEKVDHPSTGGPITTALAARQSTGRHILAQRPSSAQTRELGGDTRCMCRDWEWGEKQDSAELMLTMPSDVPSLGMRCLPNASQIRSSACRSRYGYEEPAPDSLRRRDLGAFFKWSCNV